MKRDSHFYFFVPVGITIFIYPVILLSNFLQMNIDIRQLEINVNLHSMQPGFLNYELHYIIASNENNFRFVSWNEEPQPRPGLRRRASPRCR